jgi:hypothetical protein
VPLDAAAWRSSAPDRGWTPFLSVPTRSMADLKQFRIEREKEQRE